MFYLCIYSRWFDCQIWPRLAYIWYRKSHSCVVKYDFRLALKCVQRNRASTVRRILSPLITSNIVFIWDICSQWSNCYIFQSIIKYFRSSMFIYNTRREQASPAYSFCGASRLELCCIYTQWGTQVIRLVMFSWKIVFIPGISSICMVCVVCVRCCLTNLYSPINFYFQGI